MPKFKELVEPSSNLQIQTDFTALYCVKAWQINRIAKYMTDPTFVDALSQIFKQNLGDLITRVRVYPFDIPSTLHGGSSLMGATLGGQVLKDNLGNDMIVTEITNDDISKLKIYMGEIIVPQIHHSYLDMQSIFTLYLPYLEAVNLDPEEMLSSGEPVVLQLYYIVNLYDGSLTAYVMKEFENDGERDERLLNIVNGTIGVDMPITSSNIGEIATNLLTTAVRGVALHNLGATSIIGDVMNTPIIERSNIGSFGDNLSKMFAPQYAYLKIESKKLRNPDNYLELNGKPLMAQKGLHQLKGYTEMEDIKLEDIENITSDEKSILYDLLKNGVYF